jgi:hypothetical protein
LKLSLVQSIYPISYKIAKGQTLEKGFDHLEKNDISINIELQNLSSGRYRQTTKTKR